MGPVKNFQKQHKPCESAAPLPWVALATDASDATPCCGHRGLPTLDRRQASGQHIRLQPRPHVQGPGRLVAVVKLDGAVLLQEDAQRLDDDRMGSSRNFRRRRPNLSGAEGKHA